MALRSSPLAAATSVRAIAASVAMAAPSSSVVQPPSGLRYTTAPSPTRLAVTTAGPVILIFFWSSGEVIGGSTTLPQARHKGPSHRMFFYIGRPWHTQRGKFCAKSAESVRIRIQDGRPPERYPARRRARRIAIDGSVNGPDETSA